MRTLSMLFVLVAVAASQPAHWLCLAVRAMTIAVR